MTRDFALLLAARLLRAFGFGFAAILVPLQLERRGLEATAIGIGLGIAVLAAGLGSVAWARASQRLGRRGSLALIGVLMALTGVDLGLARPAWLLMAAGVTGMLGAAAIDLAPFAAIEQAVLAESVEPRRRNRAFSRYAITGGLATAAGGLSSSLASGSRGDAFFLVYALIGIVTAFLATRLSAAVEGEPPPSLRSTSLPPAIYSLAALFALDALGGGLVVNSVIAYWLHVRFDAGLQVLGPAFTAIALVQVASYELAGRLADRLGLVRTMVLTHLPSNVLLAVVPLAPNLALALLALILRFSLSQMDVPTRQAYVVSIVPSGDRASAAALMTAARGTTAAIGPAIAGVAIQSAAFGLPFFLGGGIKILYDVLLYLGFRRRPAEHERPRWS